MFARYKVCGPERGRIVRGGDVRGPVFGYEEIAVEMATERGQVFGVLAELLR